MATIELACDAHCDLGESPIWDERTNTVYFVDINKNSIHAFDTLDSSLATITLDEPVGTIALTSDPNILIAATKRDILLVDIANGRPNGVVLATTSEEHGIENMRFNDGKVSPGGAFIVGRMHLKWRDGNRGKLYALRPGKGVEQSQELEVVLPDIHLPNGMDWQPGVMYLADSGGETITAYPTDDLGVPIPGAPTRLIAHLPSDHKHVPDGCTLDSTGTHLWLAPGESGSIVCYDLNTGNEVQRIQLPVKRPTACTFGGENLEHLYVTTRVETGADASPHHGGLFRISIPGVSGAAPAHKFPLY